MSHFGDSDGGPRGKRSKFSKFRPQKVVKPDQPLDYKNVDYLAKFIGPTGKLQSRRRTNFDGQDQRKLAAAVKMARFMGLLPFVGSLHGEQDRDPRGAREYRGRRPDGDRDRRPRSDDADDTNIDNDSED
jgi:small subunit ribosomal protein S18